MEEKIRQQTQYHSWVQQKLSPLNPLNILLLINGPLLPLGFTDPLNILLLINPNPRGQGP